MRLEDFLTAEPIQKVASNPKTWSLVDNLVGNLTMGQPVSESYNRAKGLITNPKEEIAYRQKLEDAKTPEEKFNDKLMMVIGTFGGPKAKGFAKAQAEGKTFGNLVDKMERMEIDDKAAKLLYSDINRAQLGHVLNHPELYKEYPELRQIRTTVRVDPLGDVHKGSFSSEGIYAQGADDYELKKTLLHEIQHAIQEKEGFARGGNPIIASYYLNPARIKLKNNEIELSKLKSTPEWDSFARQLDDALNTSKNATEYAAKVKPIEDNATEIVKKVRSLVKENFDLTSKIMSHKSGMDIYSKLAGEIEARDVSARMNYTPEQRANTAPYSSEPIRLEDWILNKD